MIGNTLAMTKVNSKLYRKASAENFLNEGELCTSTENSVQLIGQGDFVLVYEKKEREGIFCDGDIDAGKNYGYDEFRTELTKDDIEYIIYPDSWNDDIDEELHETDEDPQVWIYNLEDAGFVLKSELEANENINYNW